jgi:hypothetical protein
MNWRARQERAAVEGSHAGLQSRVAKMPRARRILGDSLAVVRLVAGPLALALLERITPNGRIDLPWNHHRLSRAPQMTVVLDGDAEAA